MRVHFPYLGVAVPEVELHDLLVDVLLAVYRLPLLGPVDAAMHKTRVVVVEPEQKEWDKRDDQYIPTSYTYTVGKTKFINNSTGSVYRQPTGVGRKLSRGATGRGGGRIGHRWTRYPSGGPPATVAIYV